MRTLYPKRSRCLQAVQIRPIRLPILPSSTPLPSEHILTQISHKLPQVCFRISCPPTLSKVYQLPDLWFMWIRQAPLSVFPRVNLEFATTNQFNFVVTPFQLRSLYAQFVVASRPKDSPIHLPPLLIGSTTAFS